MSFCGYSTGVPNNPLEYPHCPDEDGCVPGRVPDFVIKRYDMQPPFRVKVEDCDGPFDLNSEGLVLEANMWADGRLKTAISDVDDSLALADNIGFNQIMVGDIIMVNKPRIPEYMLVVGFDEINNLVFVQRGYNGTNASPWNKGQRIKIFRVMSAPAVIETHSDDVPNELGFFDQIATTYLVYEWRANDTCLPGCFLLEFKLLKMLTPGDQEQTGSVLPTIIPSVIGCGPGVGVEWVRRFPNHEGFLIHVKDSPTAELG